MNEKKFILEDLKCTINMCNYMQESKERLTSIRLLQEEWILD